MIRSHGDDEIGGAQQLRGYPALLVSGGIHLPLPQIGPDVRMYQLQNRHNPRRPHPDRWAGIEPGFERVFRGQAAKDIAGTYEQNGWHGGHQCATHETPDVEEMSVPSRAQVVRRGSTASARRLFAISRRIGATRAVSHP
jgi:hypothetical protein